MVTNRWRRQFLGVYFWAFEGQISRAMQCTALGTFKLRMVSVQLLLVNFPGHGMVKFRNRMINFV